MALDPLQNQIKAVIYKKTLSGDKVVYVPYLPRTNAEWVALSSEITIHGTNHSANSDLDEIIRALNTSIGAPGDVKSSDTTASLQAQINYISEELISKSGAFVYKGSGAAQGTAETPQAFCTRVLGSGTTPVAGWVFNVSNNFKIDSNGKIYISTDGDAYKAGTNVVVIGSGTEADPFKFDALGGDMGNHALTSEAVGSATLSGNTITFKHVDNSNAGTITFNTIGTTAVSTTTIATSISSGTSTAIPTEGAVFNFASSAGQVKVTAADSGYLIGVASYDAEDNNTPKPPLDFKIKVTNGKTDTPTLGANISGKAATAGTADKVKASLTVAGQTFDGSAAKTVAVGNGFTVATSGSTTTISVGAGDGITVNANNVAINKGAGLNFDSNHKLIVNVNTSNTIKAASDGIGLTTTGIATGTYSALKVDEYGRASAGAQAIIFAKGINDPDLGALVVGGLAFIGTNTAATTSYTGSAKSSGTIGVMDDAE